MNMVENEALNIALFSADAAIKAVNKAMLSSPFIKIYVISINI